MSIIKYLAAGDVVTTSIRLPRKLRDEVKIQAIRAGRSFNSHVAMILKEAAGEELGGNAPAAQTEQQVNHQEANHHVGR